MDTHFAMNFVSRHSIQRFLLGSGVLISVCLFGVSSVYAQQDAVYSQYMFNETVVNPAAAGIDGGVRAVLLYKKQWTSMPGSPNGTSFSLDGPLSNKTLEDRLGVGIHFVADRFGPNKNTGVFGSASYRFKFLKHKLALGFRGGVKTYSINWGAIEYASGYKAGGDYKNNTTVPTIGFGARYFTKNFHFGFVLDNLSEPSVALQRIGSSPYGSLYRTLLVSLGKDFRVNDKLSVETSLLVKQGHKYTPGDLRLNANLVFFRKYWLGFGFTEAGANALVGVYIVKNLMLGYASNGAVSATRGAVGRSHEVILAYDLKRKDPEIKLHLVTEDSAVVMIARRAGEGYFYFDELPDQSTYLFMMTSDDPELLKNTKEVEVRYKNTEGEEVVIMVTKENDEFFRYTFLPPLEEEKLYAINMEGDTVGVAKKNAEGYFVFEYLPNDQNLIFIQSDEIGDADMVLTVLINDKIIKLKKGEDKYFRFEVLPPEVVTLYLLGVNGDTLGSGKLNADGFFVFETLPVDQSYIFFLDARDVDLIDEVQIIQLDKKGNKKVLTLAKGDDKFFRFEYLKHEESRIYLISENGDTLMSTGRNADGFFVFEKLPIDQNYLFMLDGEEVALIDDILILTKDEKGKDKIITAGKEKGNLFRYESLPASSLSIPGLLEEDEVAFIMNTRDQRILRTTYESLKFNTGEAIIRLESYPYMEALSKMLIINSDWRIILSGFTDDVGSDHYNLLLSKQRAETVKRALVKRKVPAKQVRVKFYGESHPIAPNKTEDGRQKNRRVEMRIVQVKKD
ncbi:MAG: PorP/SprF family type IX secretion system membrane protein [Flavobacteriales bacterium]|nr:PorP/SprF family type IX secretion system membrane protein [Flavobacteriales bacterium]